MKDGIFGFLKKKDEPLPNLTAEERPEPTLELERREDFHVVDEIMLINSDSIIRE